MLICPNSTGPEDKLFLSLLPEGLKEWTQRGRGREDQSDGRLIYCTSGSCKSPLLFTANWYRQQALQQRKLVCTVCVCLLPMSAKVYTRLTNHTHTPRTGRHLHWKECGTLLSLSLKTLMRSSGLARRGSVRNNHPLISDLNF